MQLFLENEETGDENIMQPPNLKALAAAVLKHNRQCNQSATNTEKPCNFLPQNTLQKLHAGNSSCTVDEGENKSGGLMDERVKTLENKRVLHVDFQGQKEEELHNTPFTPESCINSAYRQSNHATRRFLPIAPEATDATENCESSPAAGYWDNGQYSGKGLLCFHYPYYLGRSGTPMCRNTGNVPEKGNMMTAYNFMAGFRSREMNFISR